MEIEYEKVDRFKTVNGFVDETIVDVNLDEKKISVIIGQTLIAGECNSQYIRFKVNRFYDGIDLSEKKIKILYNGPTNYHSFDVAVNVMRNDDSIIFGWIVPRGAVLKAGELQFAVEFQNFEDEDYTLKIQPTTIKVLPGMDEMEEDAPLGDTWYVELETRCRDALTKTETLLQTIPFLQYGVCYNMNTKSPTLQRVGAAVGMVAGTGVGADSNVVNDFDNTYPWSDMKRCTMTADGTITAYKGDVNYTEDGSIGNVMVEIPKFYIKRVVDENNGYIYRYICCKQLDGYRLPEGFIRNGKECDKIYVAAYPSSILNDKYSSVVGAVWENDVIEDTYTNISNGHKIANNWHCLDLQTLEILQTLFIIEFATLNSKSVFQGCGGYGAEYEIDTEHILKDTNIVTVTGVIDERNFYVGQVLNFTNANADYTNLRTVENVVIEDVETTADEVNRKATITLNEPVNIKSDTIIWEWLMTGQCNNVAASSGICGKGLDDCVPFVYRGIENFYGSLELLIEGVKITQNGYFVTNDISTYGDITKPTTDGVNYQLLSYNFPKNGSKPINGYIDKLGVDENVPYVLLPETTNGTSDTAYCDEFTGGSAIKTADCRILCNDYTSGLFGCNIVKDCDSAVIMSGRLVYAREAV